MGVMGVWTRVLGGVSPDSDVDGVVRVRPVGVGVLWMRVAVRADEALSRFTTSHNEVVLSGSRYWNALQLRGSSIGETAKGRLALYSSRVSHFACSEATDWARAAVSLKGIERNLLRTSLSMSSAYWAA